MNLNTKISKNKNTNIMAPGKVNQAKNKYIFLVLLVIFSIVILFVQFPILSADATCFDDEMYLSENVLVKNPSIESAKTFMKEILTPSDFRGYYQPFSMISIMIDYYIANTDKDLYVYHRTSLILHLLNTILLALILFTLFKNPYAATIPILIFGIHPMTVETIAWVADRKTTLAAFFALLSILSYILYIKKLRLHLYIICCIMFVFSLLSKPTGTMLPFIFLLMDFWPFERIDSKNYKFKVIEKVPLFLISFVSSIITYLSQKNTADILNPTTNILFFKFLSIFYQILHYPLKMIFPHNLTANYLPPEPFSLANPIVFFAFFGAIVIISVVLLSFSKTRTIITGCLIFFVLLLPTMGIIGVTGVIMSDKYAYLPSIGFILVISAFINYLFNKKHLNSMGIRIALILGLIIIVSIYSNITRSYITKWSDTETYYKYMITFSPENYRLYSHVGRIYFSNGNLDEAIKYIKLSIEKFPTNSDLYGDLGNALATKGDIDGAIENFTKSVSLDPDNYKSHLALGNYLNRKGSYNEAIPLYRRALELFPSQKENIKKAFNSKDCYYGLALGLFQIDKLDESFVNIQKAIELSPKYFDAYYLLGNYYNKKGELDKAIDTYDSALKMAQTDEEMFKVYFIEGITKRNMNKSTDSIESLKKSLELNPKSIVAIIELGNSYIMQKMYSESISLHENAILKFSSDAEVARIYNSWGYTLEKKGDIYSTIEKYKKALELYPDFTGAEKNLKRALMMQNSNL